MDSIFLHSPGSAQVTVLSNLFIDRYMPQANGEFVKIYIYLLRLLGDAAGTVSLELMADRLGCTEGDISRALKYWASRQLLTLEQNTAGRLIGITLSHPKESDLPQTAGKFPADTPEQPPAQPAVPAVSQPGPADAPSSQTRSASLTPARVKELRENEEVAQLLYICEQYLGKTLTPTETRKLLFFYDELHMSVDLIDFLMQYCVERGHKSMRYIETVAMAWNEEGITTVEMAKQSASRYSKTYFLILKAMGITNRSPVDSEITIMDTWLKTYGSSMELIQEACSRTILQTGQPSFQYADRILSDWHKNHILTLEDVRAQDARHQKRTSASGKKSAAAPKTPNRFNNFQQREYDYKELEKKLLGRQGSLQESRTETPN